MSVGTEQASGEEANLTVAERFHAARALVMGEGEGGGGGGDAVVGSLQRLQHDIHQLGLVSKNDSLEDISTKTLPFLSLEYLLAMAYLNVPTGFGQAQERKKNLCRSTEMFSVFLQNLERLELLSSGDQKELEELLERDDNDNSAPPPAASSRRDLKIARFRRKKELIQDMQKLESLRQRRLRLDVKKDEEMDGYDDDSLERSLALQALNIEATQAFEEWYQALRELPMVEMQAQMESRQPNPQHRQQPPKRPPPAPQRPLQVTHITQDAMTGQLSVQKEEIRAGVFRPGWSQPTMSLEQLAEKEVAEAMEREARQAEAEAQQKEGPRRYELLVKDGLEDDADLVDASAAIDREWDQFKDENPRGSGNKMGDRGDRNF